MSRAADLARNRQRRRRAGVRGGLPSDVAGFTRQLERARCFRVFVPSRTRGGHVLPVKWWAQQVLSTILPFSGGATVSVATGHWLDSQQRLTSEEVRLLDVYLPQRLSRSACQLLAFEFVRLAERMDQEVLAVVVDLRMHLVRSLAEAHMRRGERPKPPRAA